MASWSDIPEPLADLWLSTVEAESAAAGGAAIPCDRVEVTRIVHADGKGETWTSRVIREPQRDTLDLLCDYFPVLGEYFRPGGQFYQGREEG